MSLLIHLKYTLFLIHELTVQIEYSRRTAFIKRGFYRVYWCYQIGVYIICTESGIKCQSTSITFLHQKSSTESFEEMQGEGKKLI